jgi:hypothetical protein
MGRAPSPAEIRRGGFDLVDRLEGASKAASNR